MATTTASTASKGNGMVGDYDRLRRRLRIISPSKAVPLFTERPRRVGFSETELLEMPILGNPPSPDPIGPSSTGLYPPA